MLTLVAFSLIAQNVLHVRWSCDDTGLVGISLVQVVVLVCEFSVLASNVCSYSMDASLSNPIGQKSLGIPSLVSMVMRVRCSV